MLNVHQDFRNKPKEMKAYLTFDIHSASLTYPHVNHRITIHENHGRGVRQNRENQSDQTGGTFCHKPPGDTVQQSDTKKRQSPSDTNDDANKISTSVAVFDRVEDAEVAVDSHCD